MKSKEWAKLYIEAEDKDKALSSIINMLHKDLIAMRDARKISCDAPLLILFEEMDAKCRKFVSIVNEKIKDQLSGGVFESYLKNILGESMLIAYQKYLSNKKQAT